MKRFLYNNYVKFAAFILCALSVAVASYMVTSTFLKEDNMYFFEGSYEDSYMANELLSKEMRNTMYLLSNTADENGKLHADKISNVPPPSKWEYYIKTDNTVYTNVKNQTYKDFENSPLSMGVRVVHSAEKDETTRSEFSNSNGLVYYHPYVFEDAENNYEVCVRMGKDTINENAAKWNAIADKAEKAASVIIALLAFASAMVIYLLCATGRKYGEKEIQTMLVDKMFVEITAGLMLLIFIGGGALTCYAAFYFIIKLGIIIANQLSAMAIFAIVSLSLVLLLSLVRNLKNGTFIQRSLIAKVCIWAWKIVKRILLFLLKILKRIFREIKNILSEIKTTMHTVSAKHFGGRFIGIMIIAFAAGVVILTVLTMITPVFIIFLAAFVIGAVLIAAKRLIGFERVKDGIEKIKDGDLNHKIEGCPDGVFSAMAENINSIGDGLQKSLSEQVKAERMKSELITNVSHDLKTPLTSIINYADLLSKETLVPDEANDYVKIIKQKSERLKQLTNDLFDISKVQSGNEKFDIEDIDICLLVNQAMAELNEAIKKSGLAFKVTSPDKEVFVRADGRKLSRVFENLFVNCVKYSMKNTRVYIDISDGEGEVTVEIKNIAGYEMDFDEEEIAERFVRGDSARSSEGSGLGLAIVKSYVEGCSGSVAIKKDGDLFKVVMNFIK